MAEAGAFGSKHDVAGQSHFKADSQGVSADGGNHRLFDVGDFFKVLVHFFQHRGIDVGHEFVDVDAGGKGFFPAADDDGLDFVVHVHGGCRFGDFRQHPAVDGVQPVFGFERDDTGVVFDFADNFLTHVSCPNFCF